MGKFREKITHALPWIAPILDYFDWKKSVTATVAAIIIAGWSFVKDLSGPVIMTLALSILVQTLYSFIFSPPFSG
jgi:hypothetical protein